MIHALINTRLIIELSLKAYGDVFIGVAEGFLSPLPLRMPLQNPGVTERLDPLIKIGRFRWFGPLCLKDWHVRGSRCRATISNVLLTSLRLPAAS